MSISPRFSSYVASIICNTIISTTLICSILSPAAFPSSSDSFSASPTGHCYSPSVTLSDGAESTLTRQSCLPRCTHRRGHGSTSSGSTLPLTVSYKSISGPFGSKPKRNQASFIYFVDCWEPSDSMEHGGSDGNNDLFQESSSLFGDNTYLKTLFDQYPFLYRFQKLDMMRALLPQDQDHFQDTKKANELHHPLFRHKKLLSFKGFSSTSSSPLHHSPGNKTRNKRKRTSYHVKNTGAMPPLFSQRRRYPSPQDIKSPHQNQRCCFHYPRQEDSGPYQDSQQKGRPSLLDSFESIATTWKETRRSVLRTLNLIQTEFYCGGSQAAYDEDHTRHTHTPFRIKPHPKLESLASNLLVRSCLLIVLCMGAFWYCVTMMDQQQQHLGGSNWWADLGSETAAPSSIAMASSSLGTTTSEPTPSLGVDIGNDPLSSPPTPHETNSAQSTQSDRAVPHEDSSLSLLSAGIIAAFIRSTAAAVAEFSPLSTSSNSGSASTTPILLRSSAFLSSFQGSRDSLAENGSRLVPDEREQDSPKGRDSAMHDLNHTAKELESRKENIDRNPRQPCCDDFDRTGHDGYGVEMERGESSRTSSRRSSIMDIEQDGDSTKVTLTAPVSPKDLFFFWDMHRSSIVELFSKVEIEPTEQTSPPQAKEKACFRDISSFTNNSRCSQSVNRVKAIESQGDSNEIKLKIFPSFYKTR
ncbi:hypothetical protein BGZ82_007563 [Podila clonocystis]|nr:hypothetical protein BGZ82_007563 [Podila clonocystis]